MAIIPAPMDQCVKKARCQNGPNQGLAYDANNPCATGEQFVGEICDCCPAGDPCNGGVSGTLTSSLSSRAGHLAVTTFYPSVPGFAGGCTRCSDELIEVFNGSEFVGIGAPPYAVGDDYEGQKITDAVHQLALSSQCLDGLFGLQYSVVYCDPAAQSLNYCKVRVLGTQNGNFPVSVVPRNNTACPVTGTIENDIGVFWTYQDGSTSYQALITGSSNGVQIASASIVGVGGCTSGEWDCDTIPGCF